MSTPMNEAIGPKMSAASTRVTLARAVDAEHALRSGLEPARRDRLAAAVAAPVAAVLDLRERALELLLGDEQAVADADVVAPGDRLVRAVADPLAEADAGARLGRLRDLGEPLADLLEPGAQDLLDCG